MEITFPAGSLNHAIAAGNIKTGSFAEDKPSEAELARRERLKEEE